MGGWEETSPAQGPSRTGCVRILAVLNSVASGPPLLPRRSRELCCWEESDYLQHVPLRRMAFLVHYNYHGNTVIWTCLGVSNAVTSDQCLKWFFFDIFKWQVWLLTPIRCYTSVDLRIQNRAWRCFFTWCEGKFQFYRTVFWGGDWLQSWLVAITVIKVCVCVCVCNVRVYCATI